MKSQKTDESLWQKLNSSASPKMMLYVFFVVVCLAAGGIWLASRV